MLPITMTSAFTVGLGAALGWGVAAKLAFPFLQTIWDKYISHRFDRKMEDYRYDLKVREQAAKTAEYIALAWQLEAKDDKAIYQRVNQLGWELAFFLPPDIYRHVRDGVLKQEPNRNVLTALIAVRTYLLGQSAGDLDAEELAFHAPNAGKTSRH